MTATLEISSFTCELPAKTVKDHVLEDFRSAAIFEKYGLDFCCGGGRSVADACAKKGINVEDVQRELADLETFGGKTGAMNRFQDWSITFLADYIINNHHKYIRRVVPTVLMHAEKVAKVHAERWPYMIEVASLFAEVTSELSSHLYKEEAILFPRIKQLDVAQPHTPAKPFLSAPITQMMLEHDSAGEMMDRIRTLTNNYTLPEGGCTTFRTLLAELAEFERDLHQHVFLENNLLFPKALARESALTIEEKEQEETVSACSVGLHSQN